MPADHTAGLMDSLLHLYQAKAESLHQRANELIRGEASADALRDARDELDTLDQAMDQLRGDPDGPVEVTAERSVLREAVLVTIDEAGDQLSERCTALLRGEGSADAVGAGVEGLRGLLELLREAEGA